MLTEKETMRLELEAAVKARSLCEERCKQLQEERDGNLQGSVAAGSANVGHDISIAKLEEDKQLLQAQKDGLDTQLAVKEEELRTAIAQGEEKDRRIEALGKTTSDISQNVVNGDWLVNPAIPTPSNAH